MKIETLLAAGCLGATLIMDLWGVLSNRVFATPMPNYCLVGRWLRHMLGGVFAHPNIAAAARQPAECPIGWAAHYATGVLFGIALVALATPRWLQAPTLVPALAFGVVTVALPFCIMQPAFGIGLAAAKAPEPHQARLRSLMNHAVFGAGLYLSALARAVLAGIHA
jgi:hypothetical protein